MDFDPNKRNYTGQTQITVADGTVISSCNFSQYVPWVEPFTAAGLTFEDCNLTNCLLPAGTTVKTRGKTKTVPTLPDGRKYRIMQTWSTITRSVEVEPGLFQDREIEQTKSVVGTPSSWTATQVVAEQDLGAI